MKKLYALPLLLIPPSILFGSAAHAETQASKVYKQDHCTLDQCLEIKIQTIPLENSYTLAGTLHERYHGNRLKHPISGDVDDNGLVTEIRWVRKPGVADGHADVMMSKDQNTLVMKLYDINNVAHEFSFHRTK